MEDDDDEFGDLYTDVLRPLTTSSVPQPPPVQSAATSFSRSIDLHMQSDEEEVLYGAPQSNQLNFNSSQQRQRSLVSDPETIVAGSSDSHRNLNQEVDKEEGLAVAGKNLDASDLPARVLESGGEVKLQEKGFEDPKVMDEAGIDAVFDERDDKDVVLVNKNENLMERSENFEKFDIEEVNNGIGESMIPGVLDSTDNRGNEDLTTRAEVSDDWDSDSEDDLQIVLNDNNRGPMVMGVDDEDEDEDGEPLVIVADSNPNHHPMEEQDWGEHAAQAVDGERKELGEALQVNGGVAQQPKIAYSSHGYHPFHSQFKVSDIVRAATFVFLLV